MKLYNILHVVGAIFAALWFVSAITVGRGNHSLILGPLAFGPLIAASFLRIKEKK